MATEQGTSVAAAGSVEDVREEEQKPERGLARVWLEAIQLASAEEKDWRDQAEKVVNLYRQEKKRAGDAGPKADLTNRFNILFSNTETLAPALYNAPPVPDIRPRWNDESAPTMGMQAGPQGGAPADPIRRAARALERAISYSLDVYPFDDVMQAVVKDALLPGRGVARVRYVPLYDDGAGGLTDKPPEAPEGQPPPPPVHHEVRCEIVPWQDFRRGPARHWGEVPWVAFRHMMTREEITRLNPQIGPRIPLDAWVPGAQHRAQADASDKGADILKRGVVWEIWDKDNKRVLFVAPAWPDEPLAVLPDPLKLQGFFPVPKPVYAVRTAGSLVPVEPYRLYRPLAEELDEISRRIRALVRALKWRGVYLDTAAGKLMSELEKLDDGEITPVENPFGMTAETGGDLSKAFFFMPIEHCVAVLNQLYVAREQVKQTIYEVTGISDILRGSTKATETATAQQIKTQWGSLRVQDLQAEVGRFARDLIRLKAEIIAEHFPPEMLSTMVGFPVGEAEVQVLRSDVMRCYRIDIETDSTIRADLQRQQQNIATFVEGLGQFIQAVGPAVQGGVMPLPLVAEMLASFSRVFRLGRNVEEMLDLLPLQAAQIAQQMPPPGQQQAQQRAEADVERERLEFEREKHRDEMALRREEVAAKNTDLAAVRQASAALAQVVRQMTQMAQAQAEQAQAVAEMMEQGVERIERASMAMMAPRRFRRGADGTPEAAEPAGVF